MNEEENAKKLHARGEYNSYSALQRINDGKRQADRISKKEFLKRLRKALFLQYGKTASPKDPHQNKPYEHIRKKGLARIEYFSYVRKDTGITEHYSVSVYTQAGMKIIEKIMADPDFNLQKYLYKKQREQKKEQPKPDLESIQRSEKAAQESMTKIQKMLKAS